MGKKEYKRNKMYIKQIKNGRLNPTYLVIISNRNFWNTPIKRQKLSE